MRSSKLSDYIFMNYSARTSAAGGGEQTRAAAPLAEGLPGTAPASAPRPPEIPRRDQGTCGERISALCWSWDVFICCDVPDSLLWRCQQCCLVLLPLSQSFPNAAGAEAAPQDQALCEHRAWSTTTRWHGDGGNADNAAGNDNPSSGFGEALG